MRRFWLIALVIGSLSLGCDQVTQPKGKRGGPGDDGSKQNESGKLDESGGEVRFESLTLKAPKGWGRKAPQSTFILGEFVLPKVEGDGQDGRLTLSVAGGSVEANIDRWKDQFVGKPEKAQQEKIDVHGLAVTLVDLSGEYKDQKGPSAPAVKRPDYRMIGAIIPVGEQLHFVKAVGPKKTMERHADDIKAFIRSAKKQ